MSARQEQIWYNAVESVALERARQDDNGYEETHDMIVWLTMLMEGVGKLSQETLWERLNGVKSPDFRAEAVRVAAVALAMIEQIDRDNDELGGEKQ